MSNTMRAPGKSSLPLFSRMISPCLPTAHSMKRPAPDSSAFTPGLLLLEVRQGVVGHAAALLGAGTDLDAAHPAGLGEAGFDHGLVPGVLADGGLGPVGRLDDEVGLTEEAGEVPRSPRSAT